MWERYDGRVEALIGISAAGVMESLLRLAARMPPRPSALIAQVHHQCQERSGNNSLSVSMLLPMLCAGTAVNGCVQRLLLAAGGHRLSVLHVCNQGSNTSQQHGMLLLRRRCLHTPCCTTRKRGPGKKVRWDCSYPCASSTTPTGCAHMLSSVHPGA